MAALLLVVGCSEREWSEDALPLDHASVRPGEFFPQRLTGEDDPYGRSPVLDDFENGYYSAALIDAGEPPLPRAAQAAPNGPLHVRFMWIPSFQSAVIARISPTSDGQRRLVAKRIPTMSDVPMERGSIDRLLTEDESRTLDRLIKHSGVLLEPARDRSRGGIDGARWVVEAADSQRYHLIQRWSPNEGPVRQFGLAMLKLTGWQFEEVY